eukprot:PRCOL_00006310-RA
MLEESLAAAEAAGAPGAPPPAGAVPPAEVAQQMNRTSAEPAGPRAAAPARRALAAKESFAQEENRQPVGADAAATPKRAFLRRGQGVLGSTSAKKRAADKAGSAYEAAGGLLPQEPERERRAAQQRQRQREANGGSRLDNLARPKSRGGLRPTTGTAKPRDGGSNALGRSEPPPLQASRQGPPQEPARQHAQSDAQPDARERRAAALGGAAPAQEQGGVHYDSGDSWADFDDDAPGAVGAIIDDSFDRYESFGFDEEEEVELDDGADVLDGEDTGNGFDAADHLGAGVNVAALEAALDGSDQSDAGLEPGFVGAGASMTSHSNGGGAHVRDAEVERLELEEFESLEREILLQASGGRGAGPAGVGAPGAPRARSDAAQQGRHDAANGEHLPAMARADAREGSAAQVPAHCSWDPSASARAPHDNPLFAEMAGVVASVSASAGAAGARVTRQGPSAAFGRVRRSADSFAWSEESGDDYEGDATSPARRPPARGDTRLEPSNPQAPRAPASRLVRDLFYPRPAGERDEALADASIESGEREGARPAGGNTTEADAAANAEAAAALAVEAGELRKEAAEVAAERQRQRERRTALDKREQALAASEREAEQRREAEWAKFSERQAAELARLKRDRRVLEKQSRALLSMPTKAQRAEADELRAEMEALKEEHRGREARHRITEQRLRAQLADAKARNEELSAEIRRIEEQRLAQWDVAETRRERQSMASGGGGAADEASARARHQQQHAKSQRHRAALVQRHQRSRAHDDDSDQERLERHRQQEHEEQLRRQHEALRLSAEFLGVDVRDLDASSGANGGSRRSGASTSRHAHARASEAHADAHEDGLDVDAGASSAQSMRSASAGRSAGATPALSQWERLQRLPRTRTPFAPGAGGGEPARALQEVHYEDGKTEKTYANGLRCVAFANGTRKEARSNGDCSVWFSNGDAKHTLGEDGRVEYYYASVDTWHTTYGDGVEVFFFPSGQAEAHVPSGDKEIIFADGTTRRVRMADRSPSGSQGGYSGHST